MFHVFTKRLQPQKKRSTRFLAPAQRLPGRNVSWFYSWVRVLAQGQGLISWHLVERFFIWGKRLVHYPRQRARFWVNLQCGLVFTRKAKNSRMGKGKGSSAGRFTKVRSGALMMAFSFIRGGLLGKLLRQMRVRCPLHLCLETPLSGSGVSPARPMWLRHRRSRRRYARLASARAWGKTRKFRQQRIFEFITLTFFWLQRTPRLSSCFLLEHVDSSLVALRYQTASIHSLRAQPLIRWVWSGTPTARLF